MDNVITRKVKITNDNGEVVNINVNFDFNGVSNEELVAWAVANRVIAFQRPKRALNIDEIKALDGTTVNAKDCGCKVMTKDDKIRMVMNLGYNQEQAELIVNNEAQFINDMEE